MSNYSMENQKKPTTRLEDVLRRPWRFKMHVWIFSILIALSCIIQVDLWSHFNKSKEVHKEWTTEKVDNFLILDKLKVLKNGNDELVFYLKNTETGVEITKNVSVKTFLSHKKGDKVGFNMSKADYNNGEYPDTVPMKILCLTFFALIASIIAYVLQDFTEDPSYNMEYRDGHYRYESYVNKLQGTIMGLFFTCLIISLVSPLVYAILY